MHCVHLANEYIFAICAIFQCARVFFQVWSRINIFTYRFGVAASVRDSVNNWFNQIAWMYSYAKRTSWFHVNAYMNLSMNICHTYNYILMMMMNFRRIHSCTEIASSTQSQSNLLLDKWAREGQIEWESGKWGDTHNTAMKHMLYTTHTAAVRFLLSPQSFLPRLLRFDQKKIKQKWKWKLNARISHLWSTRSVKIHNIHCGWSTCIHHELLKKITKNIWQNRKGTTITNRKTLLQIKKDMPAMAFLKMTQLDERLQAISQTDKDVENRSVIDKNWTFAFEVFIDFDCESPV